MVLPYEDWSGSTIGTVPIGQGIAVTPLQMVSAYAAIGNGGVACRPHLIAKIGGKKVSHGQGRRIVSRRTADRMMSMFRDVVVEGTGTEAAIPGYTVAGKTGTANKAENGRYVSKYVASFVGLVPARKPRLAILVMVDEPRGRSSAASSRRRSSATSRASRCSTSRCRRTPPSRSASSLSPRSVHHLPRRGGTAGHPSGSGGLAPTIAAMELDALIRALAPGT